jgi:ribosome-dependent ATPase
MRFGDFTAVDHVELRIGRGEIFGFLGSNGCGKTTTMKMLTGLLPPSEGRALLFGSRSRCGDLETRARRLHVPVLLALRRTDGAAEPRAARAAVPPAEPGAAPRVQEMVDASGSATYARRAAADGAAARHPPAPVAGGRGDPQARMLILDEPTSGVDPVARDDFWRLLDRPVAQGRRDHLRLDPLHERGRALRPHLADACRPRAGERHARRRWSRAAWRPLEDAFVRYLEGGRRRRCPRPGAYPAADRRPAAASRSTRAAAFSRCAPVRLCAPRGAGTDARSGAGSPSRCSARSFWC